MKKQTSKTLALRAETIRSLSQIDLIGAAGGMMNNTRSCNGCPGPTGAGGSSGAGETTRCTNSLWCASVGPNC